MNTESQLNDKEQTVLLKLKQHWQNPPSLSHWQNPPSLCHSNPLNSFHHCNWPEITCTSGTVTQLLLQNKNITQTVPPFICDLKNLTVIDLSNNFISQEFPKALYYNCSKLEDLDLSQNYFNGTIPVDIHSLSRLRSLNLGANSFSGILPSDIISWKTLNTLNVCRNKISVPIPEELGNLAGLTGLDLSENQLSGQIPPQLGLLKLNLLNLSSNHLIGRIPTQFENDAYASSFLNNLALCANKPSLNINSCNNSDHHKSSKVPSIYLALIISLVAAALLGLIVSISMIRKRKRPEFSYLRNWEEWIGMGGTGEEEEENDDDYLLTAPLLKELEISGSQLLKERFQRGTGENWHKISHISNIKLDWVYVQRDGEPQFDSKGISRAKQEEVILATREAVLNY